MLLNMKDENSLSFYNSLFLDSNTYKGYKEILSGESKTIAGRTFISEFTF